MSRSFTLGRADVSKQKNPRVGSSVTALLFNIFVHISCIKHYVVHCQRYNERAADRQGDDDSFVNARIGDVYRTSHDVLELTK